MLRDVPMSAMRSYQSRALAPFNQVAAIGSYEPSLNTVLLINVDRELLLSAIAKKPQTGSTTTFVK